MKKLLALALVLAMALSMAACGSQPKEENSGEQTPATQEPETPETEPAEGETPEEPQEQTPAGEDNTGDGTSLSEEEYKTKMNELMTQISELTNDAAANMNLSDAAALLEAQKKLVEEVTPIYQEMINLKAPEKYAGTHADIANSLEASVEVLNLTVEILENPTDADKVAELQAKLAELQPMAESLQDSFASLEG